MDSAQAALIYATQPVWAVGLAAVFLGERIQGAELLGAVLLVGAVLAAARRPSQPRSRVSCVVQEETEKSEEEDDA